MLSANYSYALESANLSRCGGNDVDADNRIDRKPTAILPVETFDEDSSETYLPINIGTTSIGDATKVAETYETMLYTFREITTVDYEEMLPVFRIMIPVAVLARPNGFYIDYSGNSKTLEIRLWYSNGLKLALTKSIATKVDNLVAYSIGYKRHNIVVDVADVDSLKDNIGNFIKEASQYV